MYTKCKTVNMNMIVSWRLLLRLEALIPKISDGKCITAATPISFDLKNGCTKYKLEIIVDDDYGPFYSSFYKWFILGVVMEGFSLDDVEFTKL